MSLKGVNIENFMVGCESGVELTDSLTNLWTKEYGGGGSHILTNGVGMSRARRDKFAMGEAVRSAGLRAAGQVLVEGGRPDSWSLVEDFVESCKGKRGGAECLPLATGHLCIGPGIQVF